LVGGFICAAKPIDTIPDLSENQVIVFTGGWEEVQVIEDQVTLLWFPIWEFEN
jgi:Cu/Ag efflux pump CusA